MNKCEKHNWLYEEFDEPCPLCEVAKSTTDNILRLIRNYAILTGGGVFDVKDILARLEKDIVDGNLD